MSTDETILFFKIVDPYSLKYMRFNQNVIGCPDKGTSVNSLAPPPPAAMFANADDHLSNCVKNPSQYN